MTANLLNLNSSQTEFLKQIAKIHANSLNTHIHSACNLGFIFDEHLGLSDQISTLSRPKSCFSHIRELRCIRHLIAERNSLYMLMSVEAKNFTCQKFQWG